MGFKIDGIDGESAYDFSSKSVAISGYGKTVDVGSTFKMWMVVPLGMSGCTLF